MLEPKLLKLEVEVDEKLRSYLPNPILPRANIIRLVLKLKRVGDAFSRKSASTVHQVPNGALASPLPCMLDTGKRPAPLRQP